jgi:amino acid transporter
MELWALVGLLVVIGLVLLALSMYVVQLGIKKVGRVVTFAYIVFIVTIITGSSVALAIMALAATVAAFPTGRAIRKKKEEPTGMVSHGEPISVGNAN